MEGDRRGRAVIVANPFESSLPNLGNQTPAQWQWARLVLPDIRPRRHLIPRLRNEPRLKPHILSISRQFHSNVPDSQLLQGKLTFWY